MKSSRSNDVGEELLTIDQVAEEFQVVTKTVRRLVLRGELRALRIGKLYRFKRAWVTEYLDRAAA